MTSATKLTNDERALLQTVLRRQRRDLLPVLLQIEHSTLNADTKEELRRAIASELTASGLDRTFEPTAYGLQLEALIDKLSTL